MPTVAEVAEWIAPLIGFTPGPYGGKAARGGGDHYARDFAAPRGTPVYAPRDAHVIRADARDPGGGNIVQLDHGGVTTLYAHLDRFVVGVGEKVKAGEIIGYVGSTGTLVTGNHLHMEAERGGQKFDPLDLFDPTTAAESSAYGTEARRAPLQSDGNCPKGYHRRDDGFFGIAASGEAYCERDNIVGDVVSNSLDAGKNVGIALAGVIQFFVSLLDPANWLAWASLGAGSLLSLFGLYMIWQTT